MPWDDDEFEDWLAADYITNGGFLGIFRPLDDDDDDDSYARKDEDDEDNDN